MRQLHQQKRGLQRIQRHIEALGDIILIAVWDPRPLAPSPIKRVGVS